MRFTLTPSYIMPFYSPPTAGKGKVLTGTDGDDVHYGGRNSDRMMGSEGADTFHGRSGRDTADYRYSDRKSVV